MLLRSARYQMCCSIIKLPASDSKTNCWFLVINFKRLKDQKISQIQKNPLRFKSDVRDSYVRHGFLVTRSKTNNWFLVINFK